MGCPVQFFHNLDDTQPTTRLLKNATRFSRLSSWLTLQTNSQDAFPQDSAVLPTGINSDCYDERRHFVIFNGWQQITLRNYTELDTLQKIGTTRPFMPPLATRTPPTPFTTPSQKSHVIRLPENSTPPTNVAIPTIWFQSLKGLHGIMCDIFRQPRPTVPTHAHTRQHPNAAPHYQTPGHPPPRPGLVPDDRPPDAQASPTPPSSPPLQKSHVIRLPENSTPPTNVAIPTIWFQSLKGLHGIICDIFRQPRPTVPAHARTCQHANTCQRSSAPPNPRAPATAPRPRPHPPSPPHPKSRT